jgi:molybdopterin-containing oxidoreductase family iron-sulfur binding subunit
MTAFDVNPPPPAAVPAIDRRRALKLLASAMAASLAACAKPVEQIVPYVEMPERLVPGEPLRFATTLALAGYGRGVLVTSIDGRPIKIEGNPRHPASLGATDVFAESAVLSLYDPDRSKAVRGPDGITSWDAFAAALLPHMQAAAANEGAGLRILSGRVTSPTLRRQIGDLLKSYPRAKWVSREPFGDEEARAGTMLALGRALSARPRLADARIVVALGADILGAGPEQIRFARDFAARRQASLAPQDFLRLYAVEPALSLTGANADHRLALAPHAVEAFTLALVRAFGGAVTAGELTKPARDFAAAVAADLKSNAGRAVVIPGPHLSAPVQAACHWLNAQLDGPVDYLEPPDPAGPSLGDLAGELDAGAVETLIILDANPAYAAPGELKFADAIGRARFSVHLGCHEDETAEACQWHLPQSHELESWSDLCATDGTASIVQPLIRPLYDTRTTLEVVAHLGGSPSLSSYDIVRATWRTTHPSDFDAWWRQTLHDGVIAGSASARVTPAAARLPAIPQAGRTTPVLVLTPDPCVFDGRFANNAWLQECPKPLTKQVWGNALHVAAADATRFALADGDIVRIGNGAQSVEAPVVVDPGQAEGCISATAGYGRRTGSMGRGVGFDVHALRRRDGGWLVDNITLEKTTRREPVLTTQHHFRLEGDEKDLLRSISAAALAGREDFAWPQDTALPSLLPKPAADTSAWAMVIDNSLCIGCNACVVACQAENNVPVVGPHEVAAGRDMHWLRVDAYRDAGSQRPMGFEPVPCMHCEEAPCEPVCPVAASVHDSEGLNVQVYNRCVGTRFCQSNCPYKVRRFNFFGYADGQEYGDLGAEVLKAQKNPEVTVRARGVMEKCTYCVQRISAARRSAEKEDRAIHEGEVVTACQAACPTRAISFGDLGDPASRVNALRREHHHYALLGHLGTRPRTTYLARIRNPNPAIEGETA